MTRRLTPETSTFVIAVGFTVFGLMGFVPGIMRDFGDLGLGEELGRQVRQKLEERLPAELRR